MTNSSNFDVIVIGAGIAGAGVAAELSEHVRVAVLEMEPQPGYHTTGRSAAIYTPIYGPPPIRALTRASAEFYHAPPNGFTSHPLLSPRDVMLIGREDQNEVLAATHDDLKSEGAIELLDGAQTRQRMPLLRDGYAAGAILDRGSSDIDVHGLHQGYLRLFKERGGILLTRAEVTGLSWDGVRWNVDAGAQQLHAPIIVNAAGAWCDVVGQMAGIGQIGLIPKRRTALMIGMPDGVSPQVEWPLAVDIEEQFYLKTDAGRLLISPANEDPDVPSDVQPDEMDIALCIDRIQTAFDISVRRIETSWAGLRSFVSDKCPVAGFDPCATGFFWLAGQGGYGIQSAPALSRFAASQILSQTAPADILDCGFDPASVAPDRLRKAN